jgi:translation initiation factor IF-2
MRAGCFRDKEGYALAEKMRVHILAKALNVTSKALLQKCAAEGLNVKNHMSTLTAGQEATLREWFSEGAHQTTVEVADRVDLNAVRRKKRRLAKMKTAKSKQAAAAKKDGATATVEAPAETTTAVATAPPPQAADEAPPSIAVIEAPAPEPPAPTTVEPPPAEITEAAIEIAAEAPSVPETGAPVEVQAEAPGAGQAPSADEAVAAGPAEAPPAPEPAGPPKPEPVKPAGPQHVPRPARLSGPRVVRYEAPEVDVYPPSRRRRAEAPPSPAEMPGAPPVDRSRGRRRRGASYGKETGRPEAPAGRGRGRSDYTREWRDRDLIERRERLAGATGRRIHTRRLETQQPKTARAERKTKAEVQEPFNLKDFCSAIGVPFLSVFNVLKRDHGMLCNVNSVIDKDTAELVASEFGIELTVIEAKTSLDQLEEEFESRERRHLKPRCPVVAMLGHVDHGKTSLLDRIRRSHVADGEDGGITQHIRSYNLTTPAGPVTFLDTPGHEAFTAMRARGADMTDIVVLVVAGDDGVMPQTIEAINHAKAAEVPIVVALNKIDLGRDKDVEIYGQLAANGLTPSGDWGGDVDVIPTSALTGEGITDLLEHLIALGEVMELTADARVDARGRVIEAETKEGVGPVVQVLVQEGTLRKGDIVVCGNASGKVRALHDDRGRQVDAAGPSIPVELWGLEDVPAAGDSLFQVDSMQRAKQIATEVAHRRLEEARSESRKVRSLEELFKRRDVEEAPELNVILKGDVDGSVDVLRSSLGELPSDKIRLTIRHAGVGAVNDSDVTLAEASDAIIIAFRVGTQTGAKRLAETGRVDIRYYRVVYEVIDEIIKAMEGKLAPEKKEEARATLEVRQIFKISKVGPVAGCMVTNGTVARNHLVRLIRDGAVIREDCKLESLRHFRDDVKEVRAGMECGVRLEGFDDVKPGDILEAYEIVEIAQTL